MMYILGRFSNLKDRSELYYKMGLTRIQGNLHSGMV